MSALDTQVGGHYREGGIQPVQYIEANDLRFLEASVVKRVTRHNRATGKGRQDIEKAIHELQLLLELRYAEPSMEQRVKKLGEGPVRANTGCLVCGQFIDHGGLPCPRTRVIS